ncbi:rRNA small subunit methyltransferase 1, partial [Akkermansiaceae bacterium]|nr:rRNA small subunit methyltransferase 1 [Akkermansiaceae bacterium]
MLTFVPTPIGNLGDITLRAIETLQEADLIACEDTRHSLKLLNRLEISKPLTALHDHNEDRRIPELIEKAKSGQKIAIISDAGTPCLSDPGHRLLKAARDGEVPFTVLPGPSAITTALVASGFPPHPFSFPKATLLLRESALITELAECAILAIGESAGFRFREDFGRGVIDEGRACERGFHPLLDEFHHFDRALM